METKGFHIPDELLYTKEHEWTRVQGDNVRVGITDYAAKTLNDVVYVTPPKPGDRIERSKPMGTVESIKAVSEIFAPISGVVTKANGELDSHPELINKSPYDEGWLVELRPLNYGLEKGSLMDAKAYAAYLDNLLKE